MNMDRARREAGIRRPALCLRAPAFSLAELLVVVALVLLLLGIVLPALRGGMVEARRVKCAANLRQFGTAFHQYAAEYRGAAMPLAYTQSSLLRDGVPIYWWGSNGRERVDHTRGFLWPYLHSELYDTSVFECPEQPWGSYLPQGVARQITSTYGYNGYFLSPAYTPGWSFVIGRRPWQNIDRLVETQRVFVFADTMIAGLGNRIKNTALLDPPLIFRGQGRWGVNFSPTTAFRHAGRTNALFADGHVNASGPAGGRLTAPEFGIGSVGATNDPHYVPDWRDW